MAAPVIEYGGAEGLKAYQRDAIFNDSRIAIIEASSKAGKTVGCLAWLFEKSVELGGPGRNFWWVAPVYPQAEIAFRRMKLKLPSRLYKANESKLRITLATGAILEFRSAERPDTLYGEDVYAAVLDEASRMREESWHAVRSTVTATKGMVRIIGNVRGRKNWFYRLARLAEAGTEGMVYRRISAWEAAQAGVLDKQEVEDARRDFQRLGKLDVFKELYLAEASEDGANPFGLEAIERCLIDDLSTANARVAGIDFAGRGAHNITASSDRSDLDWTAIVKLDRQGNATHLERFRLANAETMQKVETTVGRVQALGDSTGAGDPLIELLQRGGKMNIEGYVFNPRTRQDLMERLAVGIQNEEVHFPDGELRDELDNFEYEYTRSGMKYAVPVGLHDDLACALGLALWRLPKRRSTGAPLGIDGTSRWRETDAGDAYRRYQESQKPTVSAPEPDGKPVPVRGPQVITGPGAGKWSGGG